MQGLYDLADRWSKHFIYRLKRCKRLAFKRKFLSHLRQKMRQVRLEGWHIILAGDLNSSYRLDDVASGRWDMPVQTILTASQDETNNEEEWFPMACEIAKSWPRIQKYLEQFRTIEPIRVKNVMKGFIEKYRVVALVPRGDAQPKKVHSKSILLPFFFLLSICILTYKIFSFIK